MSRLCVMLTALEASGDVLGADLMRALRSRLGADVRFVGLGGSAMAAEGLESAFDITELSIVGLVEGLLAARRAARRARDLAAMAAAEDVDVAVLIDSWGFSYLAARALRRRRPKLPLIKYVAPQVWATRPGRAKALAGTFDHLLSIVAFEAPIFEQAGARVTFVGHPALDPRRVTGDPARFRARIEARAGDPILLVLPGSRPSEIARLSSPFEAALGLLKAERPELRIVVAASATVAPRVRAWVAGWPFRADVVEDEAGKADAMATATAALACSGTVTAELAVAGCAMVVAYRVGPLTYQIARRIIRTRYATLFNIAADTMIAPELLQADCNGPALAAALGPLLDDPERRARQVAAQAAALDKLGRGVGAPAQIAADVVMIAIAAKSSAALVDGNV